MYINKSLQAYLFNLGLVLFILAFGMSFYSNGTGEKELPLITLIYVCGFIAGLLTIFFDQRKGRSLVTHSFLFTFFVLYTLWLLIAPYFSHWFDMSRQTTFLLLLTPISFFICSYITPAHLHKKILTIAYLGIGLGLFVWGILHFIVTKDRPDGPFTDANVYAGVLLVFLLPIIAYWLILRRDSRLQSKVHDYLFLYIVFGVSAFICASSRSATGALLVVGILISIKLYIEFKPLSALRLILLFSVLLGSYTLISNYQIQRNLVAIELASDIGLQDRLMMWESGTAIYKDNNKLVGSGFGQFSEYYKRYRNPNEKHSTGAHVHNDYLEFLIEGGLLQLGFFIVLSIYIIINYYKLLFTRWNKNNRIDKMKWFVALNLCCVFFIQANANFIFYVATIAILIGALLGYFNRYALPDNSKLPLNKKNSIFLIIFSASGIVVLILYLNTIKFYNSEPSRNSQELNSALFSEAMTMSRVMPRSLGLNHFKIKYKLHALKTNKKTDISTKESNFIQSEIRKAKRNKQFDQYLTSYLAKYSSENPEIIPQLVKSINEKTLLNLSPEELYLLSIKYDPALLVNYFELRNIYLKNDQNDKAYELLKEQLYPTSVYAQLHPYNKNKVLTLLLDDAIKLGLAQDAELYANEFMLFNVCHEPALEVLGKKKPPECL